MSLNVKYAVVLYDLIPYEDPSTYLEKENDRRDYEAAIQQLLKSDLILSISNYTTNTFLKNFREKKHCSNNYYRGSD